ncbi:DUF4097 family beta strand repeat-containing protein [Leuconostoc mesenteroides]
MMSVEMEIRTRLDVIFSKYTPNAQLTEFKEELVADLLEAYQDFSKTDQSHNEALDDAFEQLGDIDSLLKDLSEPSTKAETNKESEPKRPYVDISNKGVHIGNLHINKQGVALGDDIILDGKNNKLQFGDWLHVDRTGARVGDKYYQFDDNVNSDINDDFENKDFKEPNWAKAHHQLTLPTSTKDFVINYSEASIHFYTNDKIDFITIDEYFSRDNRRYFATISENDDKIVINQGEHPIIFHVRTFVNIGIPRSFITGKIEVRNQAGSLYAQDLVTEKFNVQINAGNFKAKNMNTNIADWQLTSGSIKASHIEAKQVKIHAKLGAVNISNATVDYAKVNADLGSVLIDNLVGGGEFTVNSGSLRLRIDQITNDLKLNSNSGTIRLTAPANQDFNFELATKSGAINLDRNDIHYHKSFDGFKSGFVGTNPEFTIDAQAAVGSIKIY